jgi:hypothetical protein
VYHTDKAERSTHTQDGTRRDIYRVLIHIVVVLEESFYYICIIDQDWDYIYIS